MKVPLEKFIKNIINLLTLNKNYLQVQIHKQKIAFHPKETLKQK